MIADPKRRSIAKTAWLLGLAAGVPIGINAVTSATLIGKTAEELISYVALPVVVALALASGVIAARISQRPMTGLLVGLLVGTTAALLATAIRIGYSIAFYDYVRHDPAEIRDWIHRGSATFVDYLIEDRIGGFLTTTLLFGLLCGACGMVGGVIGTVATRAHRNAVLR